MQVYKKKFFTSFLLLGIYCMQMLFLTACTSEKKNTGENLLGIPAPDFRLKDIHGEEVAISKVKGKVILLRFWSTRCVSCKEEMPKLEASYKKLKEKGFEILAVNVEDPLEKAMDFAHELNLTYPILIDEDQKAANQYKVFGVPTSFFIDKEGVVRGRVFGELDEKGIENIVVPLLEGIALAPRIKEEKNEEVHNHSNHQ